MGQSAHPSPFTQQLIWLFFLTDGRIGRYVFILAVLGLVVLQALSLSQAALAPADSGRQGLWAMLFWGLAIISIWCTFALAVKRLHDFGKPGILALAMFVPIVIFIAFLVLCVVPGDRGANAYGPRSDARARG